MQIDLIRYLSLKLLSIKLSDNLQAKDIEDVTTIVLLEWEEQLVGYYVERGFLSKPQRRRGCVTSHL